MDNTINVLKKIYPPPYYDNYNNLSYDNEGLYSITHPNEANIISSNIIRILNTLNIFNNYKILDMTAGCGGNMISFCKFFTEVVGIEFNPSRYLILSKNLSSYNYNNYKIICGDSIENIDPSYDAYFIDPPWGGPDYKKNTNIELTLSNILISDLIEKIPKNKLIVLKLPFNYNVSTFNKFSLLFKLEMKNMIVLFLI